MADWPAPLYDATPYGASLQLPSGSPWEVVFIGSVASWIEPVPVSRQEPGVAEDMAVSSNRSSQVQYLSREESVQA